MPLANVEANGLKNVEVVNAAIGDRTGEVTFVENFAWGYVEPESRPTSNINERRALLGYPQAENDDIQSVPMMRIDDLVTRLSLTE